MYEIWQNWAWRGQVNARRSLEQSIFVNQSSIFGLSGLWLVLCFLLFWLARVLVLFHVTKRIKTGFYFTGCCWPVEVGTTTGSRVGHALQVQLTWPSFNLLRWTSELKQQTVFLFFSKLFCMKGEISFAFFERNNQNCHTTQSLKRWQL